MQITNLIVLGLAASASAKHFMKINFERFSNPDCVSAYKIGHTHHLEDPDCKDFSMGVPFEAYKVTTYDFAKYGWHGTDNNHTCYATVFDGHRCKGNSSTVPAFDQSHDTCETVSFPNGAKSVKISCDPMVPHVVSVPSTSLSTHTITVPSTHAHTTVTGDPYHAHVTTTVTGSSSTMTTLTLSAAKPSCTLSCA